MIAVWRIVKEEYSDTAFTGDSAAAFPGRWNVAGMKTVYAADSLSLAVLETFVHLQNEGARLKFMYFKVDIPDKIKVSELGADQLPKDWRSCPAAASTRLIGAKWAESGASAVLRVPSVLVPEEYDYLLDPLHGDFRVLKIHTARPFSFDHRMWGNRGR